MGTLLVLAGRQLLRSRGFAAGTVTFLVLLFALSFLPAGSGPAEGAVKFYLTVGWFLVFAFALVLAVALPLRVFAQEREEKLDLVLGARPATRFGILAARYLASVLVGAAALCAGAAVLWAGATVLGRRAGATGDFLAGCSVHPVPPPAVPAARVEELARELERDEAFLARHGEAGVRRIARESLAVWRLAGGDEKVIEWTGLPRTAAAGRIRFLPRVYPPWEEVEAEFRAGGQAVRRRLRSGVPAEFALGAGAIDGAGRLRLAVRIDAAGAALVNFRPPDGLAVYVPAIGFARNLLRAAALFLTVVGAFAAFGVLAAATLSSSVGGLAVVVMVVIGLGASLFTEAVGEFTAPLGHHHGGEPHGERIPLAVRRVWQQVMLWTLRLAPGLGALDPGTEVAEGRAIPWERIGASALARTCARGGAALLVAWLLFRRQELGRRR
jgi:hypothetical protein